MISLGIDFIFHTFYSINENLVIINFKSIHQYTSILEAIPYSKEHECPKQPFWRHVQEG